MMNNSEVIKKFKGTLRIADIRTAPEEIVTFVIKNRLMICEPDRPYLNCGTHWQICKPSALPDILCSLLTPGQVAQVPTRAVDEAVKRLLRHPTLRVDMEAERQRTQHLVNVKNGVYNIEKREFTENRGEVVFDYVLNFSFDPQR